MISFKTILDLRNTCYPRFMLIGSKNLQQRRETNMRKSAMLTMFQTDNKSIHNTMFYVGAAVLVASSSFMLYKSLQKVSGYQHRPLTGNSAADLSPDLGNENSASAAVNEQAQPSLFDKLSAVLPRPGFWK